MWYFSWILGIGVALSFGIVNAMWLEARQKTQEARVRHDLRARPIAPPPSRRNLASREVFFRPGPAGQARHTDANLAPD